MSTLRVPLIKELPYAATGFRIMSRGDGLILVIDQGTTGTRAALVSHNGLIVSYAYSEHTQIYPKPGWVEHNPLEIWEKVMLVVREVIEKSRVDPRRIVAMASLTRGRPRSSGTRGLGNPPTMPLSGRIGGQPHRLIT
jgi:Glycerol kinase